MKKKVDAFTLIELVIVIAILAILISIAIPKFQQTKLKAQVTAHNANVRVIKNAAILYFSDHPDETVVSMGDLATYIEGGQDMKPIKASGQSKKNFHIENREGKVLVTPGMLEISNGQVKAKVEE